MGISLASAALPSAAPTGRARPARGRRTPRTLAVALHDVEPATYDHCALIRDWLADHGVDRVTLLVIPARDLHPLSDRRPEMASWLRERELAGDAVAQPGPPVRVLSPILLRLGGWTAGRMLRLDLHPSDLSATGRMLALEALLRRASGRTAIT